MEKNIQYYSPIVMFRGQGFQLMKTFAKNFLSYFAFFRENEFRDRSENNA